MSSIGTYGYINAKVRTLRSSLLSRKQVKGLAAAPDLSALATMLQESFFHRPFLFPDAGAAIMEHAVYQEEIDSLRHVQKNAGKSVAGLLDLFIERFDSEQVKRLLRNWHSGNKTAPLTFADTVYALDFESLARADGLEQLVLGLKETPYAQILSPLLPQYHARRTVFPLEVAIDRDLYSRTWELAESLSGLDRKLLSRLLGLETDLKNLGWISRYMHYYQITPLETEAYLLPRGFRLNAHRLAGAVQAGKVQDLFNELLRGSRITLPPGGEGSMMELVERFLYYVLHREAGNAFSAFPFSLGAVLGYVYLLKIQSKNVVTLISGKSYGMQPDAIENMLVL